MFLFQLLCITGQWQRALTQLQVCGELDAGTLAMVATYRDAVQCEAVREAVMAGQTLPHVFGRPQAWVAWLAEALQADGRGDGASAAMLRAKALDAAPATSGTLNGERFEWIADADSRLGPVLEAVINGRYGWVPFAALQQGDDRGAGRSARHGVGGRRNSSSSTVATRWRCCRRATPARPTAAMVRCNWHAAPIGSNSRPPTGAASASACSSPTRRNSACSKRARSCSMRSPMPGPNRRAEA